MKKWPPNSAAECKGNQPSVPYSSNVRPREIGHLSPVGPILMFPEKISGNLIKTYVRLWKIFLMSKGQRYVHFICMENYDLLHFRLWPWPLACAMEVKIGGTPLKEDASVERKTMNDSFLKIYFHTVYSIEILILHIERERKVQKIVYSKILHYIIHIIYIYIYIYIYNVM